ncbi:MAG TPA: RHS repeat-associated core domain-containing protein [Candidatus Kapabacteria bacterium]|nr:RHS repeat-associated core domain-containing protein [Candidatus Kapabacteria bacterium]
MLSTNVLTDAVGLYSGQMGFTLPLLTIPGRNGLDMNVAIAYGGNVAAQAATWNRSAPTGVLGLGWSIPAESIAAPAGQAAAPGERSYTFLGGANGGPLVATGTNAAGLLTFALANYAFWAITYDPLRERWTIVKENGDTWIYGDTASGRSTVQWGVAWGNWRGASNRTLNQVQVAVAWNLNAITNRFGDTITYSYTNVNVPVAAADGLLYTQASYLAGITGVGGERALFTYGDKQSVEYQDPHTDPPPPDPYQDRFETKYLASIQLSGSDGQSLGSFSFLYGPTPANPTFLGSGQLSKRLLLAIERAYPDGGSMPNPKFAYYTAAGTGALYGSLQMVTLATGGTATYTYGEATPACSARDLAIAPPSVGGTTYTLPTFHFENGYTVATWLATAGSTTSMQVTAYTWDGRWLAADLGTVPLANAAAYDTTTVATAADLFAIYASGQTHLFYRNVARAGEWIQPSSGGNAWFSPPIAATSPTQLAAGTGYAALLDTVAGVLYRYDWNGIAWQDAVTLALNASGASAVYAVAATGAAITAVSAATDQTGTVAPNAYVMQRGATGTWGTTVRALAAVPGPVTAVSLFAGEAFSVLRTRSVRGATAQTTYGAFWWSPDGTSVQSTIWTTTSAASTSVPGDPLIRGSLVAIDQMTWRFNGVSWIYKDIGTIGFTSGQTVEFISVGFDQMLRRIHTSGATPYTFDLVTYNPATEQWSIPAGMSSALATALYASTASNSTTQPSSYVIFESGLYAQNPDGSWTKGADLPGAANATDIASFQLTPLYLAYQTGSGTGSQATVVSFLQNGTVQQPPGSITLTGQQIYIPGEPASALVGATAFVSYTGTYAGGPATLTLHRAVGWNVQGAQTLPVVTQVTLDAGYPQDAGVNGPVITTFTFENAAATVNSSGTAPQFNKASVLGGTANPASAPNGTEITYFFNGLTGTGSEAPLLPYPVDAAQTNAPASYSLAAGTAYASVTLDTAGTTVRQGAQYWWITTLQLGTLAMGAYARLRQTSSTLAGVTATTQTAYSTFTGLPATATAYNYLADGSLAATASAFTYFWEKYDTARSLNLLTPVVQTVVSAITDPLGTPVTTVVGDSVITWKDNWGFGGGAWAPYQTFRSTSAAAPAFDNWNGGTPASGWLLTGTVTARDANGLVVALSNVDASITSTMYDRDCLKTVAAGANADITADELSWLGFEPYEPLNGWGWTGSGTLWDFVTTTDYHTGTQSLLIPPVTSGTTGPLLVMQPASQQTAYVFGCWGVVSPTFTAGAAQWTIAVMKASDNTPIANAVAPIDMSGAKNVWTYFQKVIDLVAIRTAAGLAADVELYISIQGTNTDPNAQYCYVDELRFSPLQCAFAATVYDPVSQLPTAQIGTDGQSVRTVYDNCQRAFASVGPLERVNSITATSFSRSLTGTDPENDRFNPDFPNSVLTLTTTGDSSYEDFHNPNPADWILTPQAQWALGGGRLEYTGTSGTVLAATAVLNATALENFAASVRVTRKPGATPASVGLGDGYTYMLWVEEGVQAWRLVQDTGTQTIVLAENDWLGFSEEWIFTIVDNFVTCYAGGMEIFSAATTAPATPPANYGRVTLSLDQPGWFDDLLVLAEPRVSMAFADGMGGTTQQISIEGVNVSQVTSYPTLSSGQFLDSLGRPSVVRDPLTSPVSVKTPGTGLRRSEGDDPPPPPPTLIEGDQDVYLTDEEGNARSIGDYLAGGADGKEYTSYTYELSPLGRVLTTVAPHASAADPTLFTTTNAYGGTATLGAALHGETLVGEMPLDGADAPGDPPPANTFYVTVQSSIQSSNADDTQRLRIDRTTITDIAGRTLRVSVGWATLQKSGSQYTVTATGTSRITEYQYDTSGNLATVRLPNWFNPPAGSSAGSWTIQSTYTFEGLLASRTAPDSGTTTYLYDNAGRMRFCMDANGAAASPNIITYTKYDALGRTTETGFIQDANYNWGTDGAALAAKANTPAFPIVDPAMSSNPNYAAGAWAKRRTYDFNGDVNARYVAGRLWQTQINNGANPDYERLAYDAFGNVVTRTTRVNGYAATDYSFGYTYNNQDGVATITYPDLAGTGSPMIVGYSYDMLGRIASVDRVQPPPSTTVDAGYYATYSYGYQGTLATERLNNGQGAGNVIPRTYSYNERGLLTGIDDPYLSETLGYSGGYSGSAYYDGQIAAAGVQYKASTAWTAAPTPYTYTYGYDPVGQLTVAQCSLGESMSVALGTNGANGYDANGNILSMTRGATQNSYSYAASGGAPPVNNRVRSITSAVNVAMNFDTGTPAGDCLSDWCWYASNGGPSGPSLITTNPHSAPNCLQMPGGSLGHYNVLAYTNYLAPLGNYALGYWTRTDAGFATAIGPAGWYLTLYGTSGPLAEVLVASVTASDAWTQGNTPINVAAIAASLGLGATLSYATLELRNYRRPAGPQTGPALYVDDITLTASQAAPDYGYNGNGAITQAMARNLFAITYGTTVPLTASVQLGSASGNRVTYAYGAADQRTLAVLGSADGSQTLTKSLQLGGGLRPLATQTVNTAPGTTTTAYSVYGSGGLIAVQRGTTTEFVLNDHLGSTRVSVNAANGQATSSLDYLPFGTEWRTSGAPPTPYLFTGQQYDSETALYNYGARMYDTDLGRFYATDPAGQYPSPYTYCGNDPVNLNDPTGELSTSAMVAILGVIASGLWNLWNQWDDVHSIATGAGYFGAGAASGVVMSAVNIPLYHLSTWVGATTIPGGFLYGSTSGAFAGFLQNGLNNMVRTGNVSFAAFTENGLNAATSGGIVGGVIGGATAIVGNWAGRNAQANFVQPPASAPVGRADRYQWSTWTRFFYEPTGTYAIGQDATQGMRETGWLAHQTVVHVHPPMRSGLVRTSTVTTWAQRFFDFDHIFCQRFFRESELLRYYGNAGMNLMPTSQHFNRVTLEANIATWRRGAGYPIEQYIQRAIIRGSWIAFNAGFQLGGAALVGYAAYNATGVEQEL